jgi:hypothetical protein
MSTEKTREARWLAWVTWVAILAPLPYGLSRLLWAAGLPVGIDEWLLQDLRAPGWGSVYIAFLVLLSEGTAVFTHRYVLMRRRTVPAWVPWLGGRRVGHRTVIGALAMPIAILASANVTTVPAMLDGFTIPADNAGLPGWSFWGQVVTFWTWGIALTVATLAYWRSVRVRRPRSRGRRTRSVSASPGLRS